MFKVTLANKKHFKIDSEVSIFDGAKQSGLCLEHSCLSGRCRSCLAKVITGRTEKINLDLVLSEKETQEGYILTCNTIAKSNLELDIIDLEDLTNIKKIIVPSKIDSIKIHSKDMMVLVLRLPLNNLFKFIPGQYVNIIKGAIKRSYSLASLEVKEEKLSFFIKNYYHGVMSDYLFKRAKVGDLLRLEGPLGTFFYRNNEICERVIFLATGTGIAPIKSILDNFEKNPKLVANKEILLFWGQREVENFFWQPQYKYIQMNYYPVLSGSNHSWLGEIGHIQDVLFERNLDLSKSDIYACGSAKMIKSARKIFSEANFYSDSFLISN